MKQRCRESFSVNSVLRPETASFVGMFVPFGEFQEDDFLALIVDGVEQAVGTDAKPILGGKLGQDKLACKLLRPFAFWSRVHRKPPYGSHDGILVVGQELGQRSLECSLDSFAGKDGLVAQLESHFLEESFGGHWFPLSIFCP